MTRTGRTVAIVAFDPCDTLDFVGPLEVFSFANQTLDRSKSRRVRYIPLVVGATKRRIRSESGLSFVPHTTLERCKKLDIDTLVLTGGAGARSACKSQGLIRSIQQIARRARRVTSVCTGAFVLAQAGLLGGHRATTHWAFCKELAERFPDVFVESDPIYVRDGRLWTSAGVTAGIDLALALVQEDLGQEVASAVSRWLVVFVRRAGGQSQFSHQLTVQTSQREPLRELVAFIEDHPEAKLTVPMLAQKVGMSIRNFTRVFGTEVGISPASFVEHVRVEAARRLLESTDGSISEIASQCGFAKTDAFRMAFGRCVRLTPTEYRSRFGVRSSSSRRGEP